MKSLITLALVLVSASYSIACNCVVNASASGIDMVGVPATITNFSCTGGPVTGAVLSFSHTANCSWSTCNVIVNGVQVATNVCSSTNFNLTPYLPLTSVQVVGVDNPTDNIMDNITVNMSIQLTGPGGTPSVNFSAPDYQCAGTAIQFSNQSTCGMGYSWNFGDGTTSSQFEPTHVYTQPGYYWVSLTANTSTGAPIDTDYGYVIVSGSMPTMSLSEDTVCVGDEVSFYDNSYFNSTNNASFSINYGDGNSETSSNNWASFHHTYSSVGNYTVTMTVNSTCGTQIIDTVVHVGNNIPVQSYIQVGNASSAVCPGTPINLYTNWNYEYLFSYGDGTTGTSQTHLYNAYGTYTPSVTVQNGCGNTATYIGSNIVVSNVNHYTGYAYISQNSSTICPNSQASFWAPVAASYNWNFGDGGTSTIQNPTHLFNAPGSYAISLTLTDGCGNDTTVYNTMNVVTNLPINTSISMDNIPTEICVGDAFTYSLNNASQYQNSGSITWNFGDGTTSTNFQGYHSYASAGVYNVQCTITNACGNDTTINMNVTAGTAVPPQNTNIFTIQENFCPGDEIMLLATPYSASNTVIWDMGNGDFVNTTDTFSISQGNNYFVYHLGNYSYTNPGVYNVNATITNGCGLSVVEDIVLTIAPGSEIEEAGFFIQNDNYYCLNEEIVFQGYGGNEFFWNFGDNSGIELSSAALEPVTHSYSEPGVYNVTMVAKNNCGDTLVVVQQITIPDSQMQIITNSLDATCLNSDGTVIANVIGPNPPYSYNWTSGQTTNIVHNLPAGIYIVNVTDSKGCTDFALATISDEEAPTLAVSNVISVSCHGEDNGAIDITPIGNTSGIQYYWSNGETTQDINGLVAGPYELIATNGQGCVSVASVTVTEPDEVSVAFSSTAATCNFNNGSATAVVTGTTGPYLYIWSNGQSGATVNNLGAGVYSVTVIDHESCLTEGYVAISETNAPGIILDSLVDIGCGSGGSGIYISPIGGTSPYSYDWSNGATTDDISGLGSGQYVLTLTGANGCESNEIYTIDYETPELNPICVVTVTSSQHNKIAWEKVATSNVASYNIYKESSAAGLYYLVGNVPYNDISLFIDTISNPAVQAYRYKISAVDSCGTESPISASHKTIHLTQNIGINDEVNLIWDNYEGFSYSTYRIWRYDNVGGWQLLTSLPSNVNSYSDLNAPLATATSLHYLVEIVLDEVCVSTKIENNNTTRSNRTEAKSGPIDDLGINELIVDEAFYVYPNPTNTVINAFMQLGNVQNVTCELIDAQGRVVLNQEFETIDDGQTITLSDINAESGIYLLRFSFEDKAYFKRIMIQK